MEKNKPNVVCECGFTVTGNSQLHAEANLKNHKKSKLHKKLMMVKEKIK
ncbi:hypothetical protein LCGC14_1011910 [marine sediment metagenome]|uniref:Uncharacterized protein n=1 Tax=marine sediment metagenome TaxID=412755 RepID=A0A0F9N055_9ZZZZ